MNINLKNNPKVDTVASQECEVNYPTEYIRTTIKKILSLDVPRIKIYLSVAYFILVSIITITLYT